MARAVALLSQFAGCMRRNDALPLRTIAPVAP